MPILVEPYPNNWPKQRLMLLYLSPAPFPSEKKSNDILVLLDKLTGTRKRE